jgi:hypothetical protein
MQLSTTRPRGAHLVFAVVAALLVAAAPAAHAAVTVWGAILNGANESPPNASTGTGFAKVTIDDVALTMRVEASFQNLVSNSTNCHIHAATTLPLQGTAGVATTTPTFAGFPSGVTAGVYDNTLDMTLASSYNPAYVTANGGTVASARAALFQAIVDGKAYFNIHSVQFGPGEIRGFLVPLSTPAEPTTWGQVKGLYR